jgi:hypothetical protein
MANAEAVQLRMEDGTVVDAQVFRRPAGIDGDRPFFVATFFGVQPPRRVDGDVVVLDAEGTTIDRLETPWPSWAEFTTRRTIFQGRDPIAGRWEMYVSESQDGTPNLGLDPVGGQASCCVRLQDSQDRPQEDSRRMITGHRFTGNSGLDPANRPVL